VPRRSVKKTGILTTQQLKFITHWQGSSVAAAAAAGYSDPVNAAGKLMQQEPVRAAIRRKQNAMAEEAGKILGKQVAVCRADIINRLWELAMMSPDDTNNSIGGQVRASTALADIFASSTRRKPDAKQLEDKSQDDINFFVVHGYFPPEQEEAAPEDPQPQPPQSFLQRKDLQ